MCVSLAPFFQAPRFRAFRASLFAALGLWGIAPGLHALLLYLDVPQVQQAFQLDLLMGAVYLVSIFVDPHCSCPQSWPPRCVPAPLHGGQAAHPVEPVHCSSGTITALHIH